MSIGKPAPVPAPRSSAPSTRDPGGGGRRTDGITPQVRTEGRSSSGRGPAKKL